MPNINFSQVPRLVVTTCESELDFSQVVRIAVTHPIVDVDISQSIRVVVVKSLVLATQEGTNVFAMS